MKVNGFEIKPRADLRRADLRGANLLEADLQWADLRWADLRWADLWETNLRRADLRRADLRRADLRRADLRGADLRGANLLGAKLPNYIICPEEGGFYAFKKLANNAVAKLYIPAHAKRASSLIGRKCRASEVKTIVIYDMYTGKKIQKSKGQHDPQTTYEIGKTTYPDSYCNDPRIECSHGIHFFMTRKEAEEW